jgi:diketogulonate reductase-like aldo/keto reductase
MLPGDGVAQGRFMNSAPSFIYGTAWKEELTGDLVGRALDAGFRAIDTANQRRHYVESAVGSAVATWLETTGAARETLFLQTKFTYARGQDHRLPYDLKADVATQVAQSFSSSLEHLRTTFVDSYILHGPATSRGLADADRRAWRAMEELVRARKALQLGVSNVTREQLELFVREADVRPAFVQNRCYASTGWDREVREYCRAQGIGYQAFSLLTANARELRMPAIERAVRRTGRTAPEVVFRFALHVGMTPLTGTTSVEHMKRDLACSEFELLPDEIRSIEHVVR